MDYFSTSNHVGSIIESEWASVKAAAEKYNEDGVFTAFWGFEWSGADDNHGGTWGTRTDFRMAGSSSSLGNNTQNSVVDKYLIFSNITF